MSVRAYKITQMEYEDTPTFDLWHNEELMKMLEPYIPDDFTGGGYLEFSKEDLQEALLQAIQAKELKETRDLLIGMIKAAKKSEGWVKYWCF